MNTVGDEIRETIKSVSCMKKSENYPSTRVDFYDLVNEDGSNDFYLVINKEGQEHTFCWVREDNQNEPVSFECVLDEVSDEIKEELLFHLDVFVGG
jgi:hypothetical protein